MKQQSRAVGTLDTSPAAPVSITSRLRRRPAIDGTLAVVSLRIVFGVIWAIDAWLKWQPAFRANFGQLVSGAAHGQPAFLSGWFDLWQLIVAGHAPLFAVLTATTETYLAFAVLTGFARRVTYTIGIGYALMIWSVAEGFGGPYVPGTTDIGAAVIYSLVFWALLLLDSGRVSLDGAIAIRFPAWRRIAG
jgi:uncharacterized membrane protein YphA (DoxX/SURF4 family)